MFFVQVFDSGSGAKLGQIMREWSYLATQTAADKFNLQFHPRASLETRVIVLAAAFLIDLTIYEWLPERK